MNDENAAANNVIDPFWENILNQVKTLRGQNVPPEKYREMIGQLEKCLSLAQTEVAERITDHKKMLEQVVNGNERVTR